MKRIAGIGMASIPAKRLRSAGRSMTLSGKAGVRRAPSSSASKHHLCVLLLDIGAPNFGWLMRPHQYGKFP